MPYKTEIARRIEELINDWSISSRNMFGGMCYLDRGNMMCGVYQNFLILRLGTLQAEEAMKKPHVRPFDVAGRPMKGWIMVSEEGIMGDARTQWLKLARGFTATLPAK